MSDKNTSSSGISFGGLLFIVFLILKITGYITWSWWWVTAPLWGAIAIVGGIVMIGIVVIIIRELIKKWIN
jgi:hypothetical protein